MPFQPLSIPPGVIRPATLYDARNRWYDSQLVRWHEGVMQPWGGWAVLSNAGSSAVGGAVRGMFAWRAGSATVRVALGTRTKLYGYSAGTLTDITPAGMSTGATDASGSYFARVEAHSWQLDNFGSELVACSYTDGRILTSSGTAAATAVGGAAAPTGCKGVVVTPERFLVALAAGGDPRMVQWGDQEDLAFVADLPTNQAGSFPLVTAGQIMAGRRSRTETLIWTDADLWAMRYIGGQLVYSFVQVGNICGAISRRSMVMSDGRAFWMSGNKFFMYDGFVREIPCELADYIFNRLNLAQASKVAADIRPEFNEVIWYYPNGTENDSSVTYNWASGHWTLGGGTLARTDGIGRSGLLQYPLASGTGGAIYEHENSTAYTDEGGTVFTPFAESGPVLEAPDSRVISVTSFIPDEATLGQVNLRLYGRFYPAGSETTFGPFTLANPTDVRATARQFRLRLTQVTAGWRFGTGRIDVTPGGMR